MHINDHLANIDSERHFLAEQAWCRIARHLVEG